MKFLKILRFVCRFILRIIARIELSEMERIPASGACLAVSNHLGRLDAMLAMILSERDDIIMMVAEKYQAYWIWRWTARQLDALWLDRHNADFRTLREVQKRLKAGGMAAVAPEGTRSATGQMQPGKPGAAYLAAKTGVPIIPVAVTGTEDKVVYGRLKKFRRLDITIRVGEPFTVPPLPRKNKDEFLQKSTDEIMCRIAALLPPEYRGVYAAHPRLQELLSDQLEKEIGD
ncbi:lysophospholipid acyltransferase family protein [Candidatus Leptofilum sp.]|uniref:lysophospholipid acyltransferase family protein n=1 Tax=Candidatus Leptofilum sp. TaxID=3241576 RepID=UPI003B5A05AB